MSDLQGCLILRCKGRDVVAGIRAYHSRNLFRVDFHADVSGAVVHMIHRNLCPVRRVGRNIDVVHAGKFSRMRLIQLDDNPFGHLEQGRRDTYGSAQDDFSVVHQVGSFYNGYVDFPQKTVAHVLSDLRQVEVKVLHLVLVDGFAHVLVRLERRTERYGVRLDQCAVHLTARGTARDKAYLKFFPLCMLCFCVGSQCFRHGFRCTYR